MIVPVTVTVPPGCNLSVGGRHPGQGLRRPGSLESIRRAPSGGGHWLACYGFDAHSWVVHDPYGSCDLVRGGFTAEGGTSGKAQRYTYRNFNPRWLAEGAGSGWAWLFS